MSTRGKKIDGVLNGKLRIEQGNNRLVFSDDTTDRVIFGIKPDGSFGIRFSKDGVDVRNAAESDLILDDTFSTRTYFDDAGDARILLGFQSGGF